MIILHLKICLCVYTDNYENMKLQYKCICNQFCNKVFLYKIALIFPHTANSLFRLI